MNAAVAKRVEAVFIQVFQNNGSAPVPLQVDTPLDSSLGLESVDFAEIVVRLEQEFGKDPFAAGDTPSILTFGELVALYE